MIALLTRFSLVGLANSIIGLAIIAVLDLGFQVRPALANAVAYAIGISVSFFLTRSLVFRVRSDLGTRAWKYLLAMAFAFFLNQAVLFVMGKILGSGSIRHLVAQMMGMAAYTGANFLLCRQWVFAEKNMGLRESRQ
jgi:putative flippase GtrA